LIVDSNEVLHENSVGRCTPVGQQMTACNTLRGIDHKPIGVLGVSAEVSETCGRILDTRWSCLRIILELTHLPLSNRSPSAAGLCSPFPAITSPAPCRTSASSIPSAQMVTLCTQAEVDREAIGGYLEHTRATRMRQGLGG